MYSTIGASVLPYIVVSCESDTDIRCSDIYLVCVQLNVRARAIAQSDYPRLI